VGSPFKKCFEHLPKLGISNRLSNINTIVKQQGYLVAYNTDYAGIANCLDKYTKIKTALVIGAGSTSQTFCQYLEKREIEILLVNRSMQRLYQMPA
jgi:shikimate dehydrogenase